MEKPLATYFGGAVTAIGMTIAIGVRRSWFVDLVIQVPFIQRLQARAYRASEDLVEDELKGLVTLAEAVEVKPLYSSSTLLAIRDASSRLIQEGLTRAKNAASQRCIVSMCGRMAGLVPWRDSAHSE